MMAQKPVETPQKPVKTPQKPFKTHAHLAVVLHPTPRGLKQAMDDVEGSNAKLAVLVTKLVGTMWCAYLFTVIALLGLPAALKPGGEGIVSWIAQTFLQLVLLSVIMVGQNVQSISSDKRAENTYNDAVEILDRLDVHTRGGIADLKADAEKASTAYRAAMNELKTARISILIHDFQAGITDLSKHYVSF